MPENQNMFVELHLTFQLKGRCLLIIIIKTLSQIYYNIIKYTNDLTVN